ncbi:MAG: hypothetical protein LN415_00925 [Candidatus Thermoplasmatota archaeon]|nr:hypothetical protein [Candidatus Thermoplasmatota archaeon]
MTRWKRKSKTADKTTKKLMDSGVLNVGRRDTYSRRVANESHPPYGFWSAVQYTFVLSLFLWWMPTFGQMIAGYVGGRRAGGPWKGAIAAFIPVAIFIAVLAMADQGILTEELSYVAGVPSYIASALHANVPVLAPYIEFVAVYVTTFVESLALTLGLGLNGYLVTVIFAYIGGVVSSQRRSEMDYTRAGVPTVIVAGQYNSPFAAAKSPVPRGWDDGQQTTLGSMKKIPVASGKKASGQGKGTATPAKPKSKPGKRAETKAKGQKKKSTTTAEDRERIGRKLTERALKNYR